MNHDRYTASAPKAYGGEAVDSGGAFDPKKLNAQFKEQNHKEGMAIWR